MQEWMYDEMKQGGTDYNEVAEVERYDERMSRIRDFGAETEMIAEAAGLGEHHRVVDLGCGTGEISVGLAGRCERVIAVDISRVMLDFARKKAAARGAANIEFVQSGFLNYRHEGEPADLVVSQLSLHHLPDFWKMVALTRINAFMREGGTFFLRDIVFSLSMGKYEKTIDGAVERMAEKMGSATGFVNHIKQEYSTFDWIMEEMLYRAGFEIMSADYGDFFMAVYACRKMKARGRGGKSE